MVEPSHLKNMRTVKLDHFPKDRGEQKQNIWKKNTPPSEPSNVFPHEFPEFFWGFNTHPPKAVRLQHGDQNQNHGTNVASRDSGRSYSRKIRPLPGGPLRSLTVRRPGPGEAKDGYDLSYRGIYRNVEQKIHVFLNLLDQSFHILSQGLRV